MNEFFQQEIKVSKELRRPKKTNITGYLAIDVINKLEDLAFSLNVSRNSLFEEAILDLLKKKKASAA